MKLQLFKESDPESRKENVNSAGRAVVQKELKYAGDKLQFLAKATSASQSGGPVKSDRDGCRITVLPCTKPVRLLLAKPGKRPQKKPTISVTGDSQAVDLHFQKRDKDPVELTPADLDACDIRVDGGTVQRAGTSLVLPFGGKAATCTVTVAPWLVAVTVFGWCTPP